MGQLPATAICGNDIASSCLYVSALAIIYAGRWAPLALLIVAGVLYFFRSIYAEVVGALPLNGGAYNALLNTTSKFKASIAACLTILSYMATAVISAGEAMHYVHNIWHSLPVTGATIGVPAFFMLLTRFVGVNGLIRRMTLDRCLPQYFLKINRRGTTHRIIASFFILSVSVLLITQGGLKALAAVYTISFFIRHGTFWAWKYFIEN